MSDPGEVIDPEQAAWAAYVAARYLDRDTIAAAHHAFLAGYRAGWSEGRNDANPENPPLTP